MPIERTVIKTTSRLSLRFMPFNPKPRLLWLLATGLVVGLLPLWQAHWAVVWWAWLVIVLVVMLIDLVRVMRCPLPQVERQIDRHWPVAVWNKVQVRIENQAMRAVHLRLHDWYPDGCDCEGQPADLQLEVAGRALVNYRLRPRRRGDFDFTTCDIALDSPWGLWRRRCPLAVTSQVMVYPNYAELAKYLLLATQHRLDQLGIHQYTQRGQGGDFHQLREYRRGDALRQVDWKATSRYRRLISREYREDRDQQILFLLDCGRRMRHSDGERGHLDEALDAMLLMSFVALRQGDAVGLMSFAGHERWFAPRKGAAVINQLLNTIYDLQATTNASDYLAAAKQLIHQQRRRALVIIITNTRDEDYSELMAAARLLRAHHLVVLADLRESVLDQSVGQTPRTMEHTLRYYAADDYLAARRRAHQQLSHQGIHMLDILPEQLMAALVNEYQRLKRAGLLAV